MSNTITFEKAAIVAVKHKISKGKGNMLSIIELVANFSSTTARQLGSKFLFFDREDFPKEGFKTMELDYELVNFRLELIPKGLEQHKLDLSSEKADHFKVLKSGGKKKGRSILRLKFQVQHHGNPFEMLEYFLKVGSADGDLSITPPEQKEMFSETAPEPTANGAGKKLRRKVSIEQTEIPAAAAPEPQPAAEVPAVESNNPPAEPTVYPQLNEAGEYDLTGVEPLVKETTHALVSLFVVEVEAGFAYAYNVYFGGGVGSLAIPATHQTIRSSEAVARREAAEGAYKYCQQIKAENKTQQVKKEVAELMEWLTPFIHNEAAVAV